MSFFSAFDVVKCETNEDCHNGGACTEQRTCKCLEGTIGDHCEEITACEDLKCEATDAECQFDFETRKATCVCRDKSQVYVNGQCVGKYKVFFSLRFPSIGSMLRKCFTFINGKFSLKRCVN
ncbi:hypothetical protein TNIN_316931 [Trichonephila inaurata madagascariensis]|uniref:EGF-like domain-containing protein n=2 Tax=Trichonephila inaurata madagascariensis TaxID=2747483 RepID=A0A8X7CPS2_9ARAC|nr:hypothetical protein TNIN_316931 [Trichonephila inaurata madagascariensis]